MEYSIKETGNPNYKLISFCWDIITACQYRCSYCYALPWLTSPKNLKNVNAYKTVLKRLEMSSMKNFLIEILGGEPMLHPKIDFILETLCDNKKCTQITINTNNKLPLDKLYHLNKKGLRISTSYHPEYNRHPKTFCENVLKHNKAGFTDEQLQVNINIHNDRKYIDHYVYIIDFCNKHNILVGANYLACTPTYTCNYTDELFDEIKQKVSSLPEIPDSWSMSSDRWVGVSKYRHPKTTSIKMIGRNNEPFLMSLGEIRDKKFNQWKGFNCRPKFWQIDSNGIIRNECTDIHLDMMNRNINSLVQCPNDVCGNCEVQYNFHKTAPGEKPPIN